MLLPGGQMVLTSDNIDQNLREEALAWFVKMHSGHATSADHEEHSAWLRAHPENKQEYDKLGGLWSDLDQIADPRLRPDHRQARRHALSRRSFLAGGALAAASAGFVVLNGMPDIFVNDFYTGVGEQRNIKLPDGTLIGLDADTAINLDYSDSERRIKLPRGRAFFDVANDATRPFVVEASGGTVTALGTRFTVHQWGDTVTVSVEERSVSVSAPDNTTAQLGQGE